MPPLHADSLLGRRIAEIARDPALRLYGVALALLHVAVYQVWTTSLQPARILAPNVPPICWPFFESCHAWRLLSPAGIDVLLNVYLAGALLAALAFLRPSTVRWGWWLLLALVVLQVGVVVQDYRLRANQHYMAVWTSMVFLFAPRKRTVLPLLIVSFYFWAGILKLDPDWLSGEALHGHRPLLVPEALLPASYVYVLVLELILVFGLLMRNAVVFWAALAQVVLFHVTSWSVVGSFYPTVMFAMLSVFPLMRFLPGPASDTGGRWSVAAVIAGFGILQLVQHSFPGDTAITGEGRLFALHMIDARVACSGRVLEHRRDGSTRERVLSTVVPVRIHCDPIVFWNLAREWCRRGERDPDFVGLDLTVKAGRAAKSQLYTLVSINDFCRADVTYDVWRHNAWIAAVE